MWPVADCQCHVHGRTGGGHSWRCYSQQSGGQILHSITHAHLSRTTWSKVCVTAGCPSTCLSVPSVDRSSNVQWVCCWVPCGQEIAIFSRRRHSVTPTPQAWLAWCSAVNADIVVLTAALEGSTQTCLHLFFLQFSDVCGKLFSVHFDAELCSLFVCF